ncbi:hypothetical protein HYW75_00155 [Candidatus Pacearchaeota archaeon]|nr:hypothetical protein [Candidatus Pacearchaeota archaeon]
MANSFFYININRASRAEEFIQEFVKRFEGGEVTIPQNYNLEDDGINIYEVPPGIVIVKRKQVMKGAGTITRYDIIGGDYSDDGRLRKQAIVSQLENILQEKGE